MTNYQIFVLVISVLTVASMFFPGKSGKYNRIWAAVFFGMMAGFLYFAPTSYVSKQIYDIVGIDSEQSFGGK